MTNVTVVTIIQKIFIGVVCDVRRLASSGSDICSVPHLLFLGKSRAEIMKNMKATLAHWLNNRLEAQKIINGGGTDHEVLGALTGVPPEAFALIESCEKTDVLAAKITRWLASIPNEKRPSFVTMRQIKELFGGKDIGSWELGNALRSAGWSSSRRSWKENAPRSRIWVPPRDKNGS